MKREAEEAVDPIVAVEGRKLSDSVSGWPGVGLTLRMAGALLSGHTGIARPWSASSSEISGAAAFEEEDGGHLVGPRVSCCSSLVIPRCLWSEGWDVIHSP
jgi:hypothetical protein